MCSSNRCRVIQWIWSRIVFLQSTGLKSLFNHLQQTTHSGRDKVASINQTTFPNAFSWRQMYQLRWRSHWSLFPKDPINNILALVPIYAWRRPGDKPSFAPMVISLLTQLWFGFYNQYIRVNLDILRLEYYTENGQTGHSNFLRQMYTNNLWNIAFQLYIYIQYCLTVKVFENRKQNNLNVLIVYWRFFGSSWHGMLNSQALSYSTTSRQYYGPVRLLKISLYFACDPPNKSNFIIVFHD